ncbi:transcriptional regulator [Lactococcus garvieae]|uniref:HTH cro/C1-type domain-containing protein n=1 Tax=Lactococcus garvieae TaxID=1363 RepID=A0A1I4IBF1_9LACT|nr:transcriptional regulator [Lactococcus garvieae]SFL51690.1 hypothetical protein SAMN05216438_1155 [Lactococcus garvieae]
MKDHFFLNPPHNLSRSEHSYLRNALNAYKQGTTPSAKRTAEIAKYFNVTTDYILGNTTSREYDSERLDKSIENSKSFDGSPLDEEDKEIIHNLIKDYLENKGK